MTTALSEDERRLILALREIPDSPLRTLYTQLMLQKGFLAGTLFYPTLAHTPEIVELHGAAVDDTFREIAQAIAAEEVEERLLGPVAHTGFRRLI